MDLTLIIGYVCNIYKKSPSIRIFLNDFFIDEFECNNTISIDEMVSYRPKDGSVNKIFGYKKRNL